MTDNCAYPKCGKELTHVEGRRKKKYCGADCRMRHWKVLHPLKKKPKTKRIPIEVWNQMVIANKKLAGAVLSGINVSDIIEKPLDEIKAALHRPKNLEELKSMCPKELTGFERSEWIATERQRYGV